MNLLVAIASFHSSINIFLVIPTNDDRSDCENAVKWGKERCWVFCAARIDLDIIRRDIRFSGDGQSRKF